MSERQDPVKALLEIFGVYVLNNDFKIDIKYFLEDGTVGLNQLFI
jgi:hypothetical protein